MGYDSELIGEQARRKLPLTLLMTQCGDAPKANGSFKLCPFCGHKDSAGVFTKSGREWFKCHFTSCSTGGKTLDEAGYLGAKTGMPGGEAWTTFLKMAGVWREFDRLSPSVMPGQRGRKSRPVPPPPPPMAAEVHEAGGVRHEGEGQSLLTSAATGVESPPGEKENGPSASRPDCDFQNLPSETKQTLNETAEVSSVSPTTPSGVIPEPGLGVSTQDQVGDSVPEGPIGEEDNHEDHEGHEGSERSAEGKADAEFLDREEPWLVRQCLALIVAEQTASVSLLQRRLRLGYARALRIMAELERDGFVGPTRQAASREIRPGAAEMAASFTEEDLREPVPEGPMDEPQPAIRVPTPRSIPKLRALPADMLPGSIGAERSGETPSRAPETGALPTQEFNPVLPENVTAFPAGVTILKEDGSYRPEAEGGRRKDGSGSGGGGSGGGGPEDPEGDDPEHREGLEALREFYSQLRLNDRDREILWRKRGLTTETVNALGFVSNERERNLELLKALRPKYSFDALVQVGLYTHSRNFGEGAFGAENEPVPERQFYGYGIVGKARAQANEPDGSSGEDGAEGKERGGRGKKKGAKRRQGFEWGWIEPILIPYFDREGRVVALRPHKGNAKGKLSQVYFARRKGVGDADVIPGSGHAVVTEGEFKAAALWQAFNLNEAKTGIVPAARGGGTPVLVAAMPGIQQVKNFFVWFDLLNWLNEVDPARVIVAYDNEEKGDQKRYPEAFKAEEFKRYDVLIWGRYLAWLLGVERWDSRHCILPEVWRDAKGKADWDGALAHMVHAAKGVRQEAEGERHEGTADDADGRDENQSILTSAATGAEEPPVLELGVAPFERSDSVWAKVARFVQGEFRRALDGAKRVYELSQGYLEEDPREKHIARALKKIAYERKLPCAVEVNGVVKERALAERLILFLRDMRGLTKQDLPDGLRAWLHRLARTYKTLDGQYYMLKPLHESKLGTWQEVLQRAWRNKDDSRFKKLAWCADIALKGTPTPVSNFTLEVSHVIQRLDGKRDTMVRLENVHGEVTKLIPLDAKSLSRPSDFRVWLRNSGNMTWSAGERELQMLQMDIDHAAQWKDVVQVAICGHHKESGLTFFKDVAFDGKGAEYLPDENGIFWVSKKGWALSDTDHEGQEFCQGKPVMRPDVEFRKEDARNDHALMDEPESVRRVFENAAFWMEHTIGDKSAWLALGWMLACGAAFKVFGKYTQWPGFWVHGEQGQGKTTFIRWLLRTWGFERDSGVALKDSTKVGISIAMQQYGDLPVWLEEFQPDAPGDLVEKIKNMFNRESGLKKTFGEGSRKIIACALVSGVAMCSEPQVRSRYAHVLVSASRRKGDFYDALEESSKKEFPFLGRWVMRNREKYTEMVMGLIREWMDDKASPDLASIESRARYVHGVCYAGLLAFAWICGSQVIDAKKEEFRKFILNHALMAAAEVKRDVNVEMFFQHLVTAFGRGVFGSNRGEWRRFFYVRQTRLPHPPLRENQGEWTSYELCFRAAEVLAEIQRDLRGRGMSYPLGAVDLRAQMSTRNYFVPKPKQARFGGPAMKCWAVSLDKFPEMGYTPVEDDELAAARSEGTMEESWVDPRKGELIALCEKMGKEESTL